MLLIRYRKDNKQLTAWCGDEARFKKFKARDKNESIAILDISIPPKECNAYLFIKGKLTPNPDYQEPRPSRIELLERRVEKLETS